MTPNKKMCEKKQVLQFTLSQVKFLLSGSMYLQDIADYLNKMSGPQTRVLGQPVAHLRFNDGAKLWISFKLCFKTNIFLSCILEKYIVKGQCSLRNNKLSTKNGVGTNIIANFCLCSIRKKNPSRIWGCHKIYGKLLPL